MISGNDFSLSRESLRTRITGLNINNHRIGVGEPLGRDVLLTKNIDVTERLVLPHNRNSFTLEFSDFDFSLSEHRYAYRLKGLNDDWQITENGSNHATFINLPTGSYLFEVGAIMSDGQIQSNTASLRVDIRPQWYAGPIAWLVYTLLATVLLVAVATTVRTRRQLAFEHEERDKALKMVKMKSDFLANLAHEFKTPLSIILGHVGKLISTEANNFHSQELVSMQRNAEKMHLLIDKMVTDNETDNGALFIPSATSIVDLTRKVYDDFSPAFTDKGINTRFYCDNIRYIFMLDRVKIESALNNLLSNALKFTPAGGSVLVSVTVGRGDRRPDLRRHHHRGHRHRHPQGGAPLCLQPVLPRRLESGQEHPRLGHRALSGEDHRRDAQGLGERLLRPGQGQPLHAAAFDHEGRLVHHAGR